MLFLPKCSAGVASLADGPGGRRPLHCVHVREFAGGAWRLEATNGKALGVVRGPSAPSPADLAAGAALPAPAALAFEALVPAGDFARAMRPLGKGRSLAVLLGSREVVMAAGDTVTRCAPDGGRFVDVGAVLPGRP